MKQAQQFPAKEITLGIFLTVDEIRRYLNLSQSKAYELTHRKDFPVCRFGGSIRIPRDAFLAWVQKMTCYPSGSGLS